MESLAVLHTFWVAAADDWWLSFVLDWLAKSLAEVRVFSKWLAENGALNDCFPPFFVREIAIHLRLYVKPPFIGGSGLTPPGGAHRLHELPQRGGRTHVC